MKLKVDLTYNYIITSNTRLTGWTAALIVPLLSQDIVASPSSSVHLFLYSYRNRHISQRQILYPLLCLNRIVVRDLKLKVEERNAG